MIRLRELFVDGFGCLRAPDAPFRFVPDRITLFLDDNEAGKTTLQMALVASLYGIERDKRLLRTSLRPHGTHWFPLGGPPFGTRLRVHDGRRLVEVRWDFANGGAVGIVDLESNTDITAQWCPNGDGLALGRRLLDLSAGEFSKTCLVAQDDLSSVGRAAGLDSLVQRAADSQAGDATVARALTALRDTMRDYPEVVMLKGGALDNEIKRLEEEADDLRRRLAELDAEQQAIADEDAEFRRLTAERDELRGQEARLDYLAQVAEHVELEDRIAAVRQTQAELARLEAEHKEVAHLEGFPAEHAGDLTRWQAERLELLRQAEQAEKSAAELDTNALRPASRDLEDLGRLAAVGQDDADGVAQLLGKVKSFEADEGQLHAAMRREEDRLVDEGASIDELDRLEQRFKDLASQDGSFILDHERVSVQAAAEAEEAQRRIGEAELRVEQVLEARQRERETARQWVLRGAILAGAGVLVGILLMLWFLAVGIAVLVAIAGAGAMAALKGQRMSVAGEVLQADELAAARSEIAQLGKRAEDLAAEQRGRDDRLKGLARRYGYEQAEVLVDDYSSLDELRRQCGELMDLREQQGDMAARRQRIEAEVDAAFAQYGETRPQGMGLSAAVEGLQTRMRHARRLQQQVADFERRIAEEEERHRRHRQGAEQLTEKIRTVLNDAGIPESTSIAEGIAEYERRLKDHLRLRRLVTRDIPQTRARTVEEAEAQRWEAELDRLHRAIATQREERPGLVAVEGTEDARTYRRQRDEIRRRIGELEEQAHETGTRIVATLNRYHDEQPRLCELLEERERQVARAKRHQEALALAAAQLEEIGREVHGRWAEELNRSTSRLLGRIAPTLSDLKFDSRLHFGVWHESVTMPLSSREPGPILSAGTWDQLYLAVRLGIADFIAQRGSGGLLLLDDPFAHFDDARFRSAMGVLAEMAGERHQVVIFSCQRQRFEWLRSQNPEWFDAHVATRRIDRPATAPS